MAALIAPYSAYLTENIIDFSARSPFCLWRAPCEVNKPLIYTRGKKSVARGRLRSFRVQEQAEFTTFSFSNDPDKGTKGNERRIDEEAFFAIEAKKSFIEKFDVGLGKCRNAGSTVYGSGKKFPFRHLRRSDGEREDESELRGAKFFNFKINIICYAFIRSSSSRCGNSTVASSRAMKWKETKTKKLTYDFRGLQRRKPEEKRKK
jgi:hypothetical protein